MTRQQKDSDFTLLFSRSALISLFLVPSPVIYCIQGIEGGKQTGRSAREEKGSVEITYLHNTDSLHMQ